MPSAPRKSATRPRKSPPAGVRQALFALQLGFRETPGLVADGRDMGTVIFPNAKLKVFLTASVEARAQRRYKQLIDKGFSANMDDLLEDLQSRDARDTQRAVAPLVPAEGAHILDTSDMTADEAVEQVLGTALQDTGRTVELVGRECPRSRRASGACGVCRGCVST
jgi:cytidylate kinase